MSAEKIVSTEVNNLCPSETIEMKDEVFIKPVDINHLLARIRKEKNKNNLTNQVFFGLCLSLILIVGIILSF